MPDTETNRDPFALARESEGDAELFALIAVRRKREAYAEERGIDADERARRCTLSDEVLQQINSTRPTTLAGVLAVLDLRPSWLKVGYAPSLEPVLGSRSLLRRIKIVGKCLIHLPNAFLTGERWSDNELICIF